MTIFHFLILALATYRLSLMVSKEDGPGWIFKHFRRLVKREAPKKTHLDEGVECVWCTSMQMAILVTALNYFWSGNAFYQASVYALALSGMAIIFNQAFTKR